MVQASHVKDLVAPVSLLDTLKAIDAGTLTPAQSIEACLQRLAVVEQQIHAFVSINGHAVAEAEEAKGPLAGIALAVKDIFETRSLATEYNSPIYRGHEPVRDAALVTMANKTGSTVIGKSVTTEFAFLDPGQTRNPHNIKHTPGGSSSGSAAAIASGMAHLAFGTQTGGSIIRPAAYCGVTGYKPSYGLLPKVGIKDFSWTLDTAGLFAAKVADCAFAASAITGRNLQVDRRPTSSSQSWALSDAALGKKPMPIMSPASRRWLRASNASAPKSSNWSQASISSELSKRTRSFRIMKPLRPWLGNMPTMPIN